jgi:glycosyltransferase involved in cell wall biosynthesis
MRIGYLVPEFPSQTHIFFWREICALRELGADLTLFSTRRPKQQMRHSFKEAAQQETIYLFPPQFLSAFWVLMARPRWLIAMIGYILHLKETSLTQKVRLCGLMLVAAELHANVTKLRISHVHAHSCADSAHLLALAALSGAFTHSLTLHGDLPVYGTDHAAKFARTAFVSVVTHALQQQVMKVCDVARERLPVIRMGVNTEQFFPVAREVVENELRLITVARLAPAKGHSVALQAIKKLKEQMPSLKVNYTIVGEGEIREQIAHDITTLGLQQQAQLVGTAGEDEVARYLQAADVFILPSVGLGEAAPVSVMEAMASGLAVISSIIGGTPEMIEDGVDGFLFERGDVERLTEILMTLARDPELRKKIGAAARLKAESQFTAKGFAQQFYSRILQIKTK